MARVRSLEKGAGNARMHPTEVDCHYQVLDGSDGRRYVQLTTFGSDQRKSGPKSSQTFQFDEAGAEALIGILETAFPSLMRRRGNLRESGE